jgi:hypothetical protein
LAKEVPEEQMKQKSAIMLSFENLQYNSYLATFLGLRRGEFVQVTPSSRRQGALYSHFTRKGRRGKREELLRYKFF